MPRFLFSLCLTLLCATPLFAAESSAQPHVVMLIAEQEYKTNESLPAFAAKRLKHCRITFVWDDPKDRNRLPGIEAVGSADLLIVSVRRRTPPKEQLDVVRRYVASGKPVIGIRTASHAFSLRNEPPAEGLDSWPEFDRQVFGGNYTNHYGNALQANVQVVVGLPAESAGLIKGIPFREWIPAGGSLYRVSPLAAGAMVCVTGQVEGHPSEPVAWTFRRADGGKSFYTSLGHADDFHGDVLPQLLANAIAWSLEK